MPLININWSGRKWPARSNLAIPPLRRRSILNDVAGGKLSFSYQNLWLAHSVSPEIDSPAELSITTRNAPQTPEFDRPRAMLGVGAE